MGILEAYDILPSRSRLVHVPTGRRCRQDYFTQANNKVDWLYVCVRWDGESCVDIKPLPISEFVREENYSQTLDAAADRG